MKVTSLGYAGLYVETLDQRILIDPVFSDTIANGRLHCDFARRFSLDHLPIPTALVITQPDLMHFHRETLQQIPKAISVYHSESDSLRKDLEALGFSATVACKPWHPVESGKVRLINTASSRNNAKPGIAIYGDGSLWNIAGADASPAHAARLSRRHGPVDIVAARYQTFEQAAASYVCGASGRSEKALVVKWLNAACAGGPALIFPHGGGFHFTGSFGCLNKFLFPFSAEGIVELLRRRLGSETAVVVQPGDILQVETGKAPEWCSQASPFVRMESATAPQNWEPVDRSTLVGLENPDHRAELERLLDQFFRQQLTPWLEAELETVSSFWRPCRASGIIWQFVVETGNSDRIEHYADCASQPLAIFEGRHPFANCFTHISGQALLDVLRDAAPGNLVVLSAQSRTYENAIGLADGQFIAPPILANDEITDPLTYFLSHYNPEDQQRQVPPARLALMPIDPSEIEVLTRQGVSTNVLMKKVLLSILALSDASRLGISITEDELQTVSSWFRDFVGLESEDALSAWLDEAGLDMNGYWQIMRGFAAVSHAQARYSSEIESLIGIHQKLASARKGDR